MVDLKSQYQIIKNEIDNGIIKCLNTADYINGREVIDFKNNFEKYLNVKHVIPCANGTDALQIALMSLDLKHGDEIICPAFTYVATAEVINLLGFKPVMIDVDVNTFNIDCDKIEELITEKTKVIIPVHLYGQSCDMERILDIAQKYNLIVVEDNAQSIGAEYNFKNGTTRKTGTIGHIGCTSFFPSKNLGCYGDGGAIMTNDDHLAKKLTMITNHGQEVKYIHKILGCNSRLDTIQAAVLNVKLNFLDKYNNARNQVAEFYDKKLIELSDVIIPYRYNKSTHVFHQYTIIIKNNKRNDLQKYLKENNIPTMIYYPLPLYKQEAFSNQFENHIELNNTEYLCRSVLSLPIHTEMNIKQMEYIVEHIKSFFNLS